MWSASMLPKQFLRQEAETRFNFTSHFLCTSPQMHLQGPTQYYDSSMFVITFTVTDRNVCIQMMYWFMSSYISDLHRYNTQRIKSFIKEGKTHLAQLQFSSLQAFRLCTNCVKWSRYLFSNYTTTGKMKHIYTRPIRHPPNERQKGVTMLNVSLH
jgi:hypothetical protein